MLKPPSSTLILSTPADFECAIGGIAPIPTAIALAGQTMSTAAFVCTVAGATAGDAGLFRVGNAMVNARIGLDSRL
jgi:hypothetical protein